MGSHVIVRHSINIVFLLVAVVLLLTVLTIWYLLNEYRSRADRVDEQTAVFATLTQINDELQEQQRHSTALARYGDNDLLRSSQELRLTIEQQVVAFEKLTLETNDVNTNTGELAYAIRELQSYVVDLETKVQQQALTGNILASEIDAKRWVSLKQDLSKIVTSVKEKTQLFRRTNRSVAESMLAVLVLSAIVQAALWTLLYRLANSTSPRGRRSADFMNDSERRYRRLFENSHDGILLVDSATGRVVDANQSFTRILAFKRDEVIGKRLWEVGIFAEGFTDEQRSKVSFDKLLNQGQQYVDDMALITKARYYKKHTKKPESSIPGEGSPTPPATSLDAPFPPNPTFMEPQPVIMPKMEQKIPAA